MKDDFSATPPRVNSRRGDCAMKSHLSRKINFLKICLALCASVLLFACDLFQETPKDFLEDYGSVASVTKTDFSVTPVSQGAQQNIGSGKDVTINYVVENPGEHRLRAEISFPNNLTLSDDDFNFPENDDLLQTWTEKEDDGAGGTTTTTHTESGTNFLTSTFSITFPQSLLDTIDGDVSRFDISPTVTLYRSDYGAEERPQSSHTIRLRCNTPPADIPNAMGEKIVADGQEWLILAIELPALKDDDKTLTVEENGRTHVFEKPDGAADFDGATSSDGWTISSTAPTGIVAATYDKDGKPITPADKGWTPNCYITTDIDIKGLAPFDIVLTLTDEGGLTSQKSFTSHGRKLDPPNSTSATTLEQDESDGMATYTLQATDGATIVYSVSQTADGAKIDSGNGASPLAIRLPAGIFTITAHAEKEGFAKSDNFTSPNITVNPSVFFVSAGGSDTDNGTKLKPFATIKKAVDSFTPAPASAKIFILSDLDISEEIRANLSDKKLYLQGCNGGSAGSRVTLSCAITDKTKSLFVVDGNVEMHDLNISQTSDVITSGIFVNIKSELTLQNVSISGMTTDTGAVILNIDSGSNNPSGILNILGGVKIIGNKTNSGLAKNLQLRTGTHIKIYPGSLSETQIGVTTETEPTVTSPVTITSGYGTNYGTSLPSAFTSDKGYMLSVNAGEAQLVVSGGTIIVTPPQEIKFSFDSTDSNKIETSGDGSNITIYAFGDGVKLNADAFTNWEWSLYQGTIFTGEKESSNEIDLSNSSLPSNITYVIKVTATYGGQKYSGELHYKKT